MVSLLDPLKVRGVRLKNRIVMPPMNTEYATVEGVVTDKLIEHYTRRCKDLGLLIIEHSYVSLDGKLSKRQLGAYDDSLVAGLKRLASGVHAAGSPVILEINHAGGRCTEEITGLKPVAASRRGKARRLRLDEMEPLTNAFALAAERAILAGFDGVEVQGAHGFLLNGFFSQLTNKRVDRYGGSLENRVRFPLEVVERVREKIGKKLLLYRLGVTDLDPKGTQIGDSKKLARKLEAAGVDIIDISGGLCGSRPEQLKNKKGFFVPQAQRIKKVVDVPVIGVGGITDAEFADALVREDKVDLVAVGRALLKNPDWASKAIQTLHKHV